MTEILVNLNDYIYNLSENNIEEDIERKVNIIVETLRGAIP